MMLPPKPFILSELLSIDSTQHMALYAFLFGWKAQDKAVDNLTYTLFTHEGNFVACMMKYPKAEAKQSEWGLYAHPDDVAYSLKAADKADAQIIFPKKPSPGCGRYRRYISSSESVYRGI